MQGRLGTHRCYLQGGGNGLLRQARRLALHRPHAAGAASVVTSDAPAETKAKCFYQGIVFDMDGTLTEAHIDFADMRQRTRIPQGDLFTVLEASTPEHIRHAMAVILDIEAEAAKKVSMKPGLLELLAFLKERQVPVALVTRNTTASVQAFLDLIGPEWAGLFNPVVTREFSFVKPDKRLLLHVAQLWGLDPSGLLMVGDSFEDVEVGNAAGTATCLVAGGGNEKPGVVVQTPAGASATMTVSGLQELRNLLQAGTGLKLGWQARRAAGEVLGEEGCPAPGLDFLDWCVEQGALRPGGASFPRMGRYAGGLATSDEVGSQVLHLACGAGGLTKMMSSSGMRVLGTDVDVSAAQRRGLEAVPMAAAAARRGQLLAGSLQPAAERGPFEVVLLLGTQDDGNTDLNGWWQPESLAELLTVMDSSTGRLCVEVPLVPTTNPAAILNSLCASGLVVSASQSSQTRKGPMLRLIAQRAPVA